MRVASLLVQRSAVSSQTTRLVLCTPKLVCKCIQKQDGNCTCWAGLIRMHGKQGDYEQIVQNVHPQTLWSKQSHECAADLTSLHNVYV